MQSGPAAVVEEGRSAEEERQQGDPASEEHLQSAGCSPPPHWPWPRWPLCLLPGAAGRQVGEPWGPTLQAASSSCPHGCLPGPVLVPSQGQVGVHCPRWARRGLRGWLSSSSVVAGREGPGALAGGSVLLGPLHRARSGRQRQNCRSQLPAPHGCLFSLPPPDRHASFSSHPPLSAHFYGNQAMLAQTASLPRTPGDACPLPGACINTVGVYTSPSQTLVDTQVHVTALDGKGGGGGEGIPCSHLFLLKTPPPPPDILSDAANCTSLRPVKSHCTAVL